MDISANELFGKKKGGGIFGQKKKPGEEVKKTGFGDVSNEVNNLSRRLRILEERYLNLRKKSQLTEQNMITLNKKVHSEIRDSFAEITEIRHQIKKLAEQMQMMNSELSECAKRNDLNVIEKYVSYWEPMSFVTSQEANQIIEEKLRKYKIGK